MGAATAVGLPRRYGFECDGLGRGGRLGGWIGLRGDVAFQWPAPSTPSPKHTHLKEIGPVRRGRRHAHHPPTLLLLRLRLVLVPVSSRIRRGVQESTGPPPCGGYARYHNPDDEEDGQADAFWCEDRCWQSPPLHHPAMWPVRECAVEWGQPWFDRMYGSNRIHHQTSIQSEGSATISDDDDDVDDDGASALTRCSSSIPSISNPIPV